MKKVKLTLSVFIFFVCFVLSSEIYQMYVSTFTDVFYYFEVDSAYDKENLSAQAEDLAKKYDTGVFAVAKLSDSSATFKCTVYADDTAKDILASEYYVSEGTFSSLFSGSTYIQVYELSELANSNIQDVTLYFTSGYDAAAKIKQYLSYNCGITDTSRIGRVSSTISYGWVVMCAWCIACLLLLALTWFDIQFQRKENFVLMSLGVSKQRLIVKNVLTDTGAFALIPLLIYFALRNFIYIDYCITFAAVILIVFIILNGALYLSLLRCDFKQVLYGANINYSTLSNCYLLQAVAMILTAASLSVNIPLIVSSSGYLSLYKDIEAYEEYSFLSVTADTSEVDPDDVDTQDLIQRQAMASIFLDYYKEGKAAFCCTESYDDNDLPLIALNENAMKLVDSSPAVADTESDFTIYIPEAYEDLADYYVQSALYTGAALFGFELSDVTYESVIYSEKTSIIYFDTSYTSKLAYGFDRVKNPVFICCSIPSELIDSSANIDYTDLGSIFSDIMFLLSDEEIARLAEKYSLTSVSYISVTDRAEEYKASFSRIVLTNTVLSILLLLLEVIIIATIIKMEYMVNAKQIAIKKILGYSTFSNNKTVFLLNIFAAAIGTMTVVIASLMYGFAEWYIALLVGAVLVVLECFVILYNIHKFERANITKILKGGSL